MLARYLKAQGMVLLCGGLVGPIFLIVYFALGPMAQPYLNWMFWVGLLVTAADVLVALWLTSAGTKKAASHEQAVPERCSGTLVQINGISDTSWFVNDQQMIKVNLHFEVPGYPGFDAQETMASSPRARMQIINAHHLVALVDPATQEYEIDWNASALIAGAVPAQFSSASDNRTYDLRGQVGPLMGILQILQGQRHTDGRHHRHPVQSRRPSAGDGHSFDGPGGPATAGAAAAPAAPSAPVPPPMPAPFMPQGTGTDDRAAVARARDLACDRHHHRCGVHRQASADPVRTLTACSKTRYVA